MSLTHRLEVWLWFRTLCHESNLIEDINFNFITVSCKISSNVCGFETHSDTLCRHNLEQDRDFYSRPWCDLVVVAGVTGVGWTVDVTALDLPHWYWERCPGHHHHQHSGPVLWHHCWVHVYCLPPPLCQWVVLWSALSGGTEYSDSVLWPSWRYHLQHHIPHRIQSNQMCL